MSTSSRGPGRTLSCCPSQAHALTCHPWKLPAPEVTVSEPHPRHPSPARMFTDSRGGFPKRPLFNVRRPQGSHPRPRLPASPSPSSLNSRDSLAPWTLACQPFSSQCRKFIVLQPTFLPGGPCSCWEQMSTPPAHFEELPMIGYGHSALWRTDGRAWLHSCPSLQQK